MLERAILTRLRILDLQERYIECLDADRLEAWPEFFVDDCLYEIIPKENEDLGFPAPVIRCENKRMLRDRVVSLRHANIYQKPVYRHFLSALTWSETGDGEYRVTCNYMVINTNQLGQSLVYQTGVYQDLVVTSASGDLKFKSKRAIYDTSRVQTLLAIPI
ncbi:MAG: anthranilate 1,2-dioxygenase small subunit AndAd [Caulobacteraceae bacterium]